MEREDIGLTICIALFAVSILMMFLYGQITGYATESESTVSSNVTIGTHLAVTLSTNLSNGITFNSVSSLPATYVNASDNYNGVPLGAGAENYTSSMYINVSTDSNTAVDFCVKANAALHDAVGDVNMTLSDESYSNFSTSNFTVPGPESQAQPMTTGYVNASSSTGAGNVTYYRFWLDIPAGTPSGDYNNTINFKAGITGSAC
jgi:hypothetical protein